MMDLYKIQKTIGMIEPKDINKLSNLVSDSDCVFLLGNGGSSAICSHMAEDYTKSRKDKAMTFSDSSRLTCYANDYGYEKAYAVWLEEFASLVLNPLVVLVSSSGNSKNILNAAEVCVERGWKFVVLTGFSQNNRMRKEYAHLAEVDYWVDSKDYGIVECVHQIFLHSII